MSSSQMTSSFSRSSMSKASTKDQLNQLESDSLGSDNEFSSSSCEDLDKKSSNDKIANMNQGIVPEVDKFPLNTLEPLSEALTKGARTSGWGIPKHNLNFINDISNEKNMR